MAEKYKDGNVYGSCLCSSAVAMVGEGELRAGQTSPGRGQVLRVVSVPHQVGGRSWEWCLSLTREGAGPGCGVCPSPGRGQVPGVVSVPHQVGGRSRVWCLSLTR